MELFRLVGIGATLLIMGFMMKMVLSSSDVVDNNPTTQEQKQVLRDAGLNPDDKKVLKTQMQSQIDAIRDYQNQELPDTSR